MNTTLRPPGRRRGACQNPDNPALARPVGRGFSRWCKGAVVVPDVAFRPSTTRATPTARRRPVMSATALTGRRQSGPPRSERNAGPDAALAAAVLTFFVITLDAVVVNV